LTTPKVRLGRALRAIRSQMRLTLADVSIRTGVAVSTLSKVENGQLSLTYDKLVQLSEGLQVDITVLFSADPTVPAAPTPAVTARRSITRRRQGPLIVTPNYDCRYLCADLAHKAMVPILITIRARSIAEFSSMSSHSGEEFIYILRGSVEVHTEVYEPTVRSVGEAMYIDSAMRHAFLTTRDEPAVMLNVCHSPRSGHFRTLVEMAKAGVEGGRGVRGQLQRGGRGEDNFPPTARHRCVTSWRLHPCPVTPPSSLGVSYAPGEHTIMKHASHPAIVTRLKRARGHLEATLAMFEEGRSCLDLAQQLHTVEIVIANAKRELIHDHIEHWLGDGTSDGEMGARPRSASSKLFRSICDGKHVQFRSGLAWEPIGT
jgi:DNA-binding FrmR family transcriptional regulator/transcriptional regulator with XRE-family HTH domain